MRVNNLSHHFKGGLRSEFLFDGHVEVINENEEVIAGVFWTIDTFFVLFELALGVVLDLLGGRGG